VSTFYTIDGYNIKYKIDSFGNGSFIGVYAMEIKLGNRRLKMIDGKVCIVKLSYLGIEVKSGKFTPIKFYKNKKTGYMACCMILDGSVTLLYEHRLVYYAHNQDWDIWDTSPDNSIDHYNRKKDDNRIENLHVVTHQQNMCNTDAKGCHLDKKSGRWISRIMLDGKSIFIGRFKNEEDAHNAYIDKKLELHLI
jgi:hypothetical protein